MPPPPESGGGAGVFAGRSCPLSTAARNSRLSISTIGDTGAT